MYATVLRLGLWTLILVLVLYVLATAYPDQQWAQLIETRMLYQALVLAGSLIVLGMILRVLGIGAKSVGPKNRCRVCRTPIAHGAIYCREHLRTILSDEDEKTHHTRVRR